MISDELDRLDVDWTDLPATHSVTRDVLEEAARDKAGLRALVEQVRDRPELMALAERHRLLDKIVVYDGASGMRLRIHIATKEHRDRPHDHRFSFTSRILTGQYRHTRHELRGEIDPDIPWHVQDDVDARLVGATAVPRFATYQTAGSTYSLHHTEVHTTFTTPDTVSLFLRGPAEKDRSLITERETGRLWWRYGSEQERPDRRVSKQMTREEFDRLVDRLYQLDII